MKKRYQRFISFVLAFVFCVLAMPMSAVAEQEVAQTTATTTAEPAYTTPNNQPSADPSLGTSTGVVPNESSRDPSAVASTPASGGPIANGVYTIVSAYNGMVADIESGGNTAGTRVQQWADYGSTFNINQLFKITYLSTEGNSNYYSIRPMTNSKLGMYAYVYNGTVTLETAGTEDAYSSIMPTMTWCIATSTNGAYTIKNTVYSNGYLSTPTNSNNGEQLFTVSSPTETCNWTFRAYTGNSIDGVGLYNFYPTLIAGQTVTYSGYMYSSTPGRNGPLIYSLSKDGGSADGYATIHSRTGMLTALKPCVVQLRLTYEGAPWIWYRDVEIVFEEEYSYTLTNVNSSKLLYTQYTGLNTPVNVSDYSYAQQSLMWKIEYLESGYFKVRNESTGLYLQAPGSNSNNIPIFQSEYSDTINARFLWYFTRTSDGYYMMQSKYHKDQNLASPMYLTVYDGYAMLSTDTTNAKWKVAPLTMNINVLYDQAFIDRFGASNYKNVLQAMYSENSTGLSLKSVFKDRFGIRVNVVFSNTVYQSYPYIEDCAHKNQIDNYCLNCKNVAGYSIQEACASGLHHKSEDYILGTLPDLYLDQSTEIQILHTGFRACYYHTSGDHAQRSYGLTSGYERNSVAIFCELYTADIINDYYDAVIKTITHELLHTLGAPHCLNNCIMCSSQGTLTISALMMCESCSNIANSNKIQLYYH